MKKFSLLPYQKYVLQKCTLIWKIFANNYFSECFISWRFMQIHICEKQKNNLWCFHWQTVEKDFFPWILLGFISTDRVFTSFAKIRKNLKNFSHWTLRKMTLILLLKETIFRDPTVFKISMSKHRNHNTDFSIWFWC